MRERRRWWKEVRMRREEGEREKVGEGGGENAVGR